MSFTYQHHDNVAVRIGNFEIKNIKKEKVLGIQFDNSLTSSIIICQKYAKKLAENFIL